MKLIVISLSSGMLLLTQAQEPKQDRAVIYPTEITCKKFVEEMKREQGIIMAWLQGYFMPDHAPPIFDVDQLLSDGAKLVEHCAKNPEDDVRTAYEAIVGR